MHKVEWEGADLFNTSNGNVLAAKLFPLFQKIVVDLARAEYDTLTRRQNAFKTSTRNYDTETSSGFERMMSSSSSMRRRNSVPVSISLRVDLTQHEPRESPVRVGHTCNEGDEAGSWESSQSEVCGHRDGPIQEGVSYFWTRSKKSAMYLTPEHVEVVGGR